MALVDLKMSKQDMADEASPTAPENRNPYPYGVCLTLDTDELAKLGIKELPSVGDECHVEAVGEVTSVSEQDSGNGEQRSVRIQLQMMEVVNEGQEPEGESVAEEEAEDAESQAVGGKAPARTVVRSTYRGSA